jgi:glycosyltransferase involved in cell wall biosynthesis
MAHADVLALVSLWEGFGMPVVEAMACGTAVVVSNCSSLPEVAGDAALTVDPYDVDAIASAIRAVVTNDELRRDLVRRGLQRAAQFTWERTAQLTLDVLRNVALKQKLS